MLNIYVRKWGLYSAISFFLLSLYGWVIGNNCWAGSSINDKKGAIKIKNSQKNNKIVSPLEEVKSQTENLLEMYKKKFEIFKKDKKAFVDVLRLKLEPKIDFVYFAKGVMGHHGKFVDDNVHQTFLVTFRDTLFQFYGKAVLLVDNPNLVIENIKVNEEALKEYRDRYDFGRSRQLPVEMEARAGSKYIKIIYKMVYIGENNGEGWKVRNIIIDSLNIGVMYRKLFNESVEKVKNSAIQGSKVLNQHADKVKYVVENWSSIVQAEDAKKIVQKSDSQKITDKTE